MAPDHDMGGGAAQVPEPAGERDQIGQVPITLRVEVGGRRIDARQCVAALVLELGLPSDKAHQGRLRGDRRIQDRHWRLAGERDVKSACRPLVSVSLIVVGEMGVQLPVGRLALRCPRRATHRYNGDERCRQGSSAERAGSPLSEDSGQTSPFP